MAEWFERLEVPGSSPALTNWKIDHYHSAAILSLGGIKSFVFAR